MCYNTFIRFLSKIFKGGFSSELERDMEQCNKITLFVDFDDTISLSSETVVDILNKRYGTSKTWNDVHDWGYRSIVKTVTPQEIEEIYDSEEFWKNVKIRPEFMHFFECYKNHFIWVVVSKGNEANRAHKEQYLKKHFGDTVSLKQVSTQRSKQVVDMTDGIQIDDRTDNLLCTNATVKILLRNYRDLTWNQLCHGEELYVCNNWTEAKDIITFFNNNRMFFGKGE